MTIYIDDGELVKIYQVKDKTAKAVMALLKRNEILTCGATHKGYELAIVERKKSEEEL